MDECVYCRLMRMILKLQAGIICCLFLVFFLQKNIYAEEKPKLFIIGDSKTKYYKNDVYPRDGWVQELIPMVKGTENVYAERPEEYEQYSEVVRYNLSNLTVENWSRSHETVKSFYDSGRFGGMLDQVQSGDFVMITLGHNDARKDVGISVSKYKGYLMAFAKKIQQKGAVVIMVTTPPRNYTKKRKLTLHAPAYRKAMMQVAKKYGFSCIDLDQECVNYFNYRGKKIYNLWYMKLKAGQYPNYPQKVDDPTHFTKSGARVIAKMAAVNIQNGKKQKFLGNQLNMNTKKLYNTYKRARKYKSSRRYTPKSWKRMIKARNRAWKVLYSPNSTYRQYKTAESSLRRTMKGLKKKHG